VSVVSAPPPDGAVLDRASLDAAVEAVRQHAAAWASKPPRARIELIDRLVGDVYAVADRWASSCAAAEAGSGRPRLG